MSTVCEPVSEGVEQAVIRANILPRANTVHLTKLCAELGRVDASTKIARTHATGDRSKDVGESHGLPVNNSRSCIYEPINAVSFHGHQQNESPA